jgi:hypothetical protein
MAGEGHARQGGGRTQLPGGGGHGRGRGREWLTGGCARLWGEGARVQRGCAWVGMGARTVAFTNFRV